MLEGTHGRRHRHSPSSSDGKRLVSLAGDNKVKIWMFHLPRNCSRLMKRRRLSPSVAFSPDGHCAGQYGTPVAP